MTRPYKAKQFKLSDGTSMTAREIAEKYDVKLSTTRTRLSNGVRDVELLNKQPRESRQHATAQRRNADGYIPELSVKEKVAQRNYFDPMSRLLLRTLS